VKVGRKFVTRCTITGCFALAVLVSGCAKKKPATAADYYGSLDYQNRALLQQSLFRSDEERLSNAEIETILSSRIQLPQSAHLTILRLGAIDETLSWAFPPIPSRCSPRRPGWHACPGCPRSWCPRS